MANLEKKLIPLKKYFNITISRNYALSFLQMEIDLGRDVLADFNKTCLEINPS